MKDHICFSFWLPKKDAESFRSALDSAHKKERRRVGVAEVVWPAISNFIKKDNK